MPLSARAIGQTRLNEEDIEQRVVKRITVVFDENLVSGSDS